MTQPLPACHTSVATGIVLDTLDNTVELCYDDRSLPSHYRSEVFTPVCQSTECLPVRIDLLWTLAGNYLGFSLPGNEILTKVDHLHFTPEDYHKLNQVLKNPNGTLKYLRKEDFHFVHPKDSSLAIDGTTGATKQVSKRDYVEGAIFTSLTLFQLVNGPATVAAKNFTLDKLICTDNIDYFVMHPDRPTAELGFEWLSRNLAPDELIATLFELMDGKSPQVTDLAVRYLPAGSIETDSVENKMSALYALTTTSNATRSQLLALWKGRTLLPGTQIIIAAGLLRFRENFPEVLSLLDEQENWPDEVYVHLCEALGNEPNLSRKEKIYHVIEKRNDSLPKNLRKKIRVLERANGWS